jgi:hypothetical protein
MEFIGHLQSRAICNPLPPSLEKEATPRVLEVGEASKQIWSFWRRENSLASGCDKPLA